MLFSGNTSLILPIASKFRCNPFTLQCSAYKLPHVASLHPSSLRILCRRCLSSVPGSNSAMTASILDGLPEQCGVLNTIILKDGRQLSYSDCGDKAGRVVLFFHPIQGNRYMPLIFHDLAAELKLRIIGPDRPGVGHSSPSPGFVVQDYPADVAELCKQLGIQQFSIMASSAGTMYALACTIAPATRNMIAGPVTIIAPWIPPSSRPQGSWNLLSILARWTPLPLLQAVVGFSNGKIARQSQGRPITDLMTRSNEQEKAAFAAGPHNDSIYRAMINQWNQSLSGIMQEMQLCMERTEQQQLHFNYSKDITVHVRVYMGTADKVLHFSNVQQWADQSDNVELILVSGGTHDGLMHTHKAAALQALSQDVDSLQQHCCR